MKKLSKILIISLIFAMILSCFYTSKAVTWDTALNIVREAMNDKYFNNNQGLVTHRITSIDSKAGEVKLQMTVTNVAEQVAVNDQETEIYIVLSETLVRDESNYATYCSYIETLARKVFNVSSNSKIGIIGMRGPVSELHDDDGDGYEDRGPNDEGEVDGTENDSEVVIRATNDLASLKNALNNMNREKKDYYVNLQSALITAEQTFSPDANKILISLFDDVPSTSVGTHDTIYYSTIAEAEAKVEERYQTLVDNTKSEIYNLERENIELILLRPDDSRFNRKWYSYNTGELIVDFDGSAYVNDLYGTVENPTYGKLYSLERTPLQTIITNYIYADILETMEQKLTSVRIYKYFTNEILENFDITLDDADGNVNTNSIKDGYWVWYVPDLAPNEVAVLNYTLKIKDMNNDKLFDLVLPVDDRIDIEYPDPSNPNETITETEETSPQIKLTGTEIKQEPQKEDNGPKKDNTTAKTPLPYTGAKIFITITIGAIIITAFVLYVKYRKLDDVK